MIVIKKQRLILESKYLGLGDDSDIYYICD